MSKWREKTKSVRAQGEIQRRDWNPAPDSVHLRMYQWWQARSSRADDISRENFCHYWRVVMIWAPLRWVWPKLLILLGVAAVVALAVGIFVYGSSFAIIIGYVVAGLIYFVVSIDVTVYLYGKLRGRHPSASGSGLFSYDEIKPVYFAAIVLVTSPGIAVVSAIAATVAGIMYGIKAVRANRYVHASMLAIGRFFRAIGKGIAAAFVWLFTADFSDRWWLTWIRPYLIVPIGFAVLGCWHPWAFVPAIAMAFVIVIVMAVLGLSYLADEAKRAALDRRDAAIKAEMDKFFHNMFALQHPKYAGDDIRYQKWFARYNRFMKDKYGEDVYDEHAPIWRYFDYEDGLMRKYIDMYGEMIGGHSFALRYIYRQRSLRDKPKKKCQSGAVEFLSFVWSVVLVNKWKICPIVEIPERV